MQPPPIPPLLDEYLQHLAVERGLAENTISAYVADLRDFFKFIQQRGLGLNELSEQDLFLYIVWARRHKLSGRSLARRLSALRGFFMFAREQEELTQDPARFLENPKFQRQLPEVLSEVEMRAILMQPNVHEKIGFRDRTMLELLYASGLRVSELCALKPLDFDMQAGWVRVFGKGAKERIVPVHHEALRWLMDYLAHWRTSFRPAENFVFLNRSGKGVSRVAVWKCVRRYALAAGIMRNISPHSFRHSFATHLLDGGADLRSVQMLLGHADINATEIYTHVQAGRLLEVHRARHPRSSQS